MRGQAMVETALTLPILLLVMVGALWFPIAELVRSQLVHMAQEGARAGAADGDCDAALAAAGATSTRSRATAACEVDPGPPAVVWVTVSETIPVPPLLDRFTNGVISGMAGSVVTP